MSALQLRAIKSDTLRRWNVSAFADRRQFKARISLVKKYILAERQYRCAGVAERRFVCDVPLTSPIYHHKCLLLDHIDGDWRNNDRSNLRLLCPNCHSLTPTYKAKNRTHWRKWRLKEKQQRRASLASARRAAKAKQEVENIMKEFNDEVAQLEVQRRSSSSSSSSSSAADPFATPASSRGCFEDA